MGSRGTLILNGDTGLRSISSWFDLSKKKSFLKSHLMPKAREFCLKSGLSLSCLGFVCIFLCWGACLCLVFFFGGVV